VVCPPECDTSPHIRRTCVRFEGPRKVNDDDDDYYYFFLHYILQTKRNIIIIRSCAGARGNYHENAPCPRDPSRVCVHILLLYVVGTPPLRTRYVLVISTAPLRRGTHQDEYRFSEITENPLVTFLESRVYVRTYVRMHANRVVKLSVN